MLMCKPQNKPVWLLAAVLLGTTLFSGQVAAGERLPYRVLQVESCPEVQPAPAAPYAYGWFGAAPRTHATRNFGYYRLYTEYSWR